MYKDFPADNKGNLAIKSSTFVGSFASNPQMQEVAHIHEHVQNQSSHPFHKPNHMQAGICLFCQGLQELGQYQEIFGSRCALLFCTLH